MLYFWKSLFTMFTWQYFIKLFFVQQCLESFYEQILKVLKCCHDIALIDELGVFFLCYVLLLILEFKCFKDSKRQNASEM